MFQNRLKELREQKDLSQRELAKLLNVSSGTIAMYETGKRRPDNDTLIKIANFFNVSIDYLLDNGSKELLNTLPEIKDFAEKLDKMSKQKRDKLLKIGNELFEILTKDDKE